MVESLWTILTRPLQDVLNHVIPRGPERKVVQQVVQQQHPQVTKAVLREILGMVDFTTKVAIQGVAKPNNLLVRVAQEQCKHVLLDGTHWALAQDDVLFERFCKSISGCLASTETLVVRDAQDWLPRPAEQLVKLVSLCPKLTAFDLSMRAPWVTPHGEAKSFVDGSQADQLRTLWERCLGRLDRVAWRFQTNSDVVDAGAALHDASETKVVSRVVRLPDGLSFEGVFAGRVLHAGLEELYVDLAIRPGPVDVERITASCPRLRVIEFDMMGDYGREVQGNAWDSDQCLAHLVTTYAKRLESLRWTFRRNASDPEVAKVSSVDAWHKIIWPAILTCRKLERLRVPSPTMDESFVQRMVQSLPRLTQLHLTSPYRLLDYHVAQAQQDWIPHLASAYGPRLVQLVGIVRRLPEGAASTSYEKKRMDEDLDRLEAAWKQLTGLRVLPLMKLPALSLMRVLPSLPHIQQLAYDSPMQVARGDAWHALWAHGSMQQLRFLDVILPTPDGKQTTADYLRVVVQGRSQLEGLRIQCRDHTVLGDADWLRVAWACPNLRVFIVKHWIKTSGHDTSHFSMHWQTLRTWLNACPRLRAVILWNRHGEFEVTPNPPWAPIDDDDGPLRHAVSEWDTVVGIRPFNLDFRDRTDIVIRTPDRFLRDYNVRVDILMEARLMWQWFEDAWDTEQSTFAPSATSQRAMRSEPPPAARLEPPAAKGTLVPRASTGSILMWVH